MTEDAKQITRFTEFVYSWINTFKYSEISQVIISISDYDEAEIVAFYKFVIENQNNLWVKFEMSIYSGSHDI